MKKILTAFAMALLLVGCAQKYDDSAIKTRLTDLERRVVELETSMQALQYALGDGVFVSKVEEFKDPETQKTIGLTITYNSGAVYNYSIEPKIDVNAPVVSIITSGSGDLVWAVDGVAILVDGKEVALPTTPLFYIDDDGYLWVKVDGKDDENLGKVASDGAALQNGIFTNLAVEADKVVLTLSDASVVEIPFAKAFKLNLEQTEFGFIGDEIVEVPYTVTAAPEGTVVGVAGYNPNDFDIEVQAEKIVITPMHSKAAAVMLVFADSKVGLVSTQNIIVEGEGVDVEDEPYSEDIDYMSEGEDGLVVAHVVANVEFDAKPVEDWIHVESVKAKVKSSITLVLDDNTSGAIRTGSVQLFKKGTETLVQTITIAQDKITKPAVILDKKESANCYIITEAGKYKFSPVKGNSGVSVGEVATVELLWETQNSSTTPEQNSVIKSLRLVKDLVTFGTPETLVPGNALIAAKDAAGTILWSWHIWIPATEITTVDAGFAGTNAILDRNLGALVATPTTAKDLSSEGLYYQWGRKDPLIGCKIKAVPSSAVGQYVGSATDITVEKGIQNPLVYYYNEGKDWLATEDATLWDNNGAKTQYDPCPAGYKVPAYDNTLDMWKKLENADFPTKWTYAEANGYVKFTEGTATFPLCGYINGSGQDQSGYGKRSLVWSSTRKSATHGQGMFVRENKYYSDGNHKACGASVRCIAEDVAPEPEVVYTDLSTDGTANCYVISKAGAYKFPAVQGNSNTSVGEVASAELIWETYNNASDVALNSVVASVGYKEGYITFSTPETLQPGNALIAAMDAEENILWSWHIWIPKEAVTSADYTSFIGGAMMNMNLGALEAVPATGSATFESLGLLYQWGRKDPFVGAASWASSATKAKVASAAGYAFGVLKEQTTLEVAIKTPTTYYFDGSDDHDWLTTSDGTLWNGGAKTIYDPCPAGYIVPSNSGSLWTQSDDAWTPDQDNHVLVHGASGVRMPFAGFIESYGGNWYGTGGGKDSAYIWSATAHDTARSKCVLYRYDKSPKYYKQYRGRANAGTVRCIAEVVPN